MTCQIYRHFNENDELLYVGISLGAVARLSQHRTSPWFYEIKRVEIQKCTDRREALVLEASAIISEKPKYNKKGKNPVLATKIFNSAEVKTRREKKQRWAADVAAYLADEAAAAAFRYQIRTAPKKETDMTELELAATNFFRAVLKTGHDILGHTEFHFKIDATIGTPPKDAELGKMIGMRIQEALNVAKVASKPITIEGTTS